MRVGIRKSYFKHRLIRRQYIQKSSIYFFLPVAKSNRDTTLKQAQDEKQVNKHIKDEAQYFFYLILSSQTIIYQSCLTLKYV